MYGQVTIYMLIDPPELPFELHELEPFASRESVDIHYNKHHRWHHERLKERIKGTMFQSMTLSDIVMNSEGDVFINAAETWNHSFYWQCLSPKNGGLPSEDVLEAIEKSFGSIANFKSEFEMSVMDLVGSGWVWLVKTFNGQLRIITTRNAETPRVDLNTLPLLTIDVWEHAYYIDYADQRSAYLKNYWDFVNWEFVADNFRQW